MGRPALVNVLYLFYGLGMLDHDPRPTLRLVAAGSRPTAPGDPRVLRDFTRVCEVVGIVDPETGLIRCPQRAGPQPSS
jgi:hypothetical protein